MKKVKKKLLNTLRIIIKIKHYLLISINHHLVIFLSKTNKKKEPGNLPLSHKIP